jgi:hypothetical protein
VERGQPLATIYATRPERLAEPVAILKQAIRFSESPPRAAVPLVSRIFTCAEAEIYLRQCEQRQSYAGAANIK